MPQESPVIVAHRGWHLRYPENSLPAFQAAWEFHLLWAECDVHVLADGVVVFHDDTLERMTEFTGQVLDHTAADLRNCRLRSGDDSLTEYRIPQLREVIAAMPQHCRLMIEVKSVAAGVNLMASLMREIGDRPVMIQSFDPNHLRLAREYDSTLSLAYLVDSEAALANAIQSPFPAIHLNQVLLNEQSAKQIRRTGKYIGVWTVNAETDLRRVIALQPGMIITDDPPQALKMIELTR